MRHTPTLDFVLDAVPENARHIEDLLARARAADAEVARNAAGAQYAGDPDPYRHDVGEVDEPERADGTGDAADRG
jgi:ribosome-binding factor A